MAIFLSPFPRIAYFSFYTSLYPLSNVHVWVRFSRTDTCPISPYPKWLGVVVKVEKYCSVWRRVFNCSNGNLSFVLCRHIAQGSFLYQRGCVQFFLKLFLYRSCPFFQGDFGCAEDRIVLGYVSGLLEFLLHVLSYTPPQLGPWALI